MKKEIVSFRKDIIPNSEGHLYERIKDNGQVQEVRIRFYAGQTQELQVRPFVLHKGNKPEDMVTYPEGTQPYFSGEDDYFVFPVNVNIEYDDQLAIWYKNVNLEFNYTLVVDVMILYTVEEV